MNNKILIKLIFALAILLGTNYVAYIFPINKRASLIIDNEAYANKACPIGKAADEIVRIGKKYNLNPEEVESALLSTLEIIKSPKYLKVFFDGRRLYKLKDLNPGVPPYIDPTVNKVILNKLKNGASNLDLMIAGKAPIGIDGKQINLHHILGEEPGPMAEIFANVHETYHKTLHAIIEKSFRNDPNLLKAFNKFKEQYWKNRAKDYQ